MTLADGLRERKKADTRRALSAAAVRLCLERGYHHVTVSDIADAAGVSRRTFSNYFAGKAECVTAFGESVLDDMLDVVAAGRGRCTWTTSCTTCSAGTPSGWTPAWTPTSCSCRARTTCARPPWPPTATQLARVGDALAELVGAEPGDLRTQAAAGCAALIARMVGDRWIAAGRPGGREGLIAQFDRCLRRPRPDRPAAPPTGPPPADR